MTDRLGSDRPSLGTARLWSTIASALGGRYVCRMKARRGAVEWIGGSMIMPAPDDETEVLETFFWLNAGGDLLGTATYVAREMPERLGDSFIATTESPAVGQPHVPARIRVASEAHAAVLRRAVGAATEVVCAPTPETEPVRVSLAAYLDKVASASEETYLSSAIEPEVVGGLFRALARLYVAAPWRKVTRDDTCASVTIKALGVRSASLVIEGGSVPGILVFPDEASAMEYRQMDLDDGGLDDDDIVVPPHIAVMLIRGGDIEPERRKEIAKHGWTVAGPAAYPEINAFDEDGMPRPASVRELAMMEAIAQCLVALIETKPDTFRAIADGESFEVTLEAETSRGRVSVELGTPRRVHDDGFLGDEEGDADEEDEEAEVAVAENLIRQFRRAPEGARLNPYHDWPRLLLDHARMFFRVRPEDLTPVIVEEVVFSSFPEKVSCPPEVAASMVGELRAFFAYLERGDRFAEAAACARLFGEDAEKKLRDRLADPRAFGMAKTMIMAGIEAGFDVSTEEGMAAWLGTAAETLFPGDPSFDDRGSRGAPAPLRLVSSSRTSPASRAAKPKKKKESRAKRSTPKGARSRRKK